LRKRKAGTGLMIKRRIRQILWTGKKE